MHPIVAYGMAMTRMADLQSEADRERLANSARAARSAQQTSNREPLIPARWALRRFFARLHLAGSEA